MGRLAKLLTFTRSSDEDGNVSVVKCDLGGGNIVEADYYAPPGDDACPLPGDFVVLVPATGAGNWSAIGFMDPEIAGSAAPGERIIYSRSAPGVIAAKLHLKADGSMEFSNATGRKVTFTATGAIEADDEVSAKMLVPAQKVSLSTHLHPTGVGPTSPPTPGS